MNLSQQYTCKNFPGTQAMSFNPSLAVFNGVLYITFENYSNDHNLSYFTSTDQGQTIALSTALAGDQSSRGATLQVFTKATSTIPALYVGFRANDSSQSFIYRYTTNGTSWAADGAISSPWSMAGAPALMDASKVGVSNTLYNFSATTGSSFPNLQVYSGTPAP